MVGKLLSTFPLQIPIYLFLIFIDVYIKTGIAQISNTPMVLITASADSVPFILQTVQTTVTAAIIRMLW